MTISSKVTYIKNDKISENHRINIQELERTLNSGLISHFSKKKYKEVWKSLFKSRDVVAIKVNCLAGKGLSTHPELVKVIISQLEKIGISRKNIIVFDRANRDLQKAGFKVAKSKNGIRCAGNDHFGYQSNLLIHNTIGSMLSNVMKDTDAIINVPVLKDHGIVGLSGALKNFFGVIHNPNKYHLNVGDPYVADLCSHNMIKNKTRLTICDSVIAQYEGGPPFMPQYAINENALLISQDMVALDRIGWQLIDSWRKQNNLPTLKQVNREPKYILTASDNDHQVGEADLNRIQFNRIGL